MNTKQKLTLGIAAVFMVTLTIIGVTYAYFVTRITGEVDTETVNVSTARLASVQYADGNGVIEMADVIPGESVYKSFTVVNNSTEANALYDVFLETVPVNAEKNEAGNDYAIPFVHATDTTNCYTDTAYAERATLTECYNGSTYNNIVYTLYKVDSLDGELATLATSDKVVGTADTAVGYNKTNADPQIILDDATILASASESAKTTHYYILKVTYNNVDANQNIENKAALDILVDIR